MPGTCGAASLFLLSALLVLPGNAWCQDIDAPGLAESALPAIVAIRGVTLDGKESSGSGFIVDSSGTIITSLHVVEDLVEGAVRLSGGDVYDGLTVSSFDRRRDIAIVQIAGFDLPTLPIGNSSELRPGDPVLLLGGPLGLEGSVSAGIVSAVRQEEGTTVIQTDAAASPGNSGGPMINARGEAVGVVAFRRLGGENLNFVIPINYARGLLSSPVRSMLLSELRTELSEAGVDLFDTDASAFPGRWMSMQNGTNRNIRMDGDHLYYDVELPASEAAVGAFTLGDLEKAVDGHYEGTARVRFRCLHVSAWDGAQSIKWWSEEIPVELSLVSDSRIEGRVYDYPDNDEMNCRTGGHSKPRSWQQFVWIAN